MKFTTESGTKYEISADRKQVRRVMTNGGIMRRDGAWLNLLNDPIVKVGGRVHMVLEPLSEGADATFRTTSPVVSIEE